MVQQWKSNGKKARIVGQGAPKTRDRPAAEKRDLSLDCGILSGWRAALGGNMLTPMTPGPKPPGQCCYAPRKSITSSSNGCSRLSGHALLRTGIPARSRHMAEHVSPFTLSCDPQEHQLIGTTPLYQEIMDASLRQLHPR